MKRALLILAFLCMSVAGFAQTYAPYLTYPYTWTHGSGTSCSPQPSCYAFWTGTYEWPTLAAGLDNNFTEVITSAENYGQLWYSPSPHSPSTLSKSIPAAAWPVPGSSTNYAVYVEVYSFKNGTGYPQISVYIDGNILNVQQYPTNHNISGEPTVLVLNDTGTTAEFQWALFTSQTPPQGNAAHTVKITFDQNSSSEVGTSFAVAQVVIVPVTGVNNVSTYCSILDQNLGQLLSYNLDTAWIYGGSTSAAEVCQGYGSRGDTIWLTNGPMKMVGSGATCDTAPCIINLAIYP